MPACSMARGSSANLSAMAKNRGGHHGAGELGAALHLLGVDNRHNPRDDRHLDAHGQHPVQEVVIHVVVKEHLGGE